MACIYFKGYGPLFPEKNLQTQRTNLNQSTGLTKT